MTVDDLKVAIRTIENALRREPDRRDLLMNLAAIKKWLKKKEDK